MSDVQVLLARQPIYTRDLSIFAYELLYRPPREKVDSGWDGDAATAELLVNALLEVGLAEISGGKKSFVNFTRNALLSLPDLDPRLVGVEVLESIQPDRELIRAVQSVSDLGFTVSLDDFNYHADWLPLLDIADIVKVDVLQHEGESLVRLCEQLAPFDVKLIAEKVETYEVFQACRELGFDYFQGYFFARPQNVAGATMASSRMVVLTLLADLQEPHLDLERLEQTIVKDLALTMKILKLCNSLHYSPRGPVNSVRQAILLIGLDALRKWASIIALSRLSDKPPFLLSFALTRAKTLEILARDVRLGHPDSYFTVGIFSLVDAFFDRNKSELVESLPFAEEIRMAILEGAGVPGLLLEAIESHEAGNWEAIDWERLESYGITPPRVTSAYIAAIAWARDMTNALEH